jgi:predicted RNase H-like HicB family nuclease
MGQSPARGSPFHCCHGNGKTIEEAKWNIREAIQQRHRSLPANGQAIPQNERLVHAEELTVAVP